MKQCNNEAMKSINLKTTPEVTVISQAVSVLRRGGLLIYPTETVYGLGVDAANQQAVNKLLKFKGQRGLKPILISVSDQNMAEEYVDLNSVARRLYRTFLPGPVAVVSKTKAPQVSRVSQVAQAKNKLARGITSPEGTVGIRIPNYPLILKIIKAFGRPITSTSANISGARNPWSINDIKESTPMGKLKLIDLVLNAGQLQKREPSTVIDTSHEKTEIVRKGPIDISKIKNQKSKIQTITSSSAKETIRVGEQLMRNLSKQLSSTKKPIVIALQGPLGAGKTVFTKGIATALGITAPIRSPSYTLVKEYPFLREACATCDPRGTFFHVDAWRLHLQEEFQDLGLEQMLKRGNVIVIEWVERLAPILKELQKKVKIILAEIKVTDENRREITIYRLTG